jgi:putative SOS response-associated peptidase YedK
MMPVIVRRERTEAIIMQWGLNSGLMKNGKGAPPLTINARAEKITEESGIRPPPREEQVSCPRNRFLRMEKRLQKNNSLLHTPEGGLYVCFRRSL